MEIGNETTEQLQEDLTRFKSLYFNLKNEESKAEDTVIGMECARSIRQNFRDWTIKRVFKKLNQSWALKFSNWQMSLTKQNKTLL